MSRMFFMLVLSLGAMILRGPAVGEPVTLDRIQHLAASEQPAWEAYWERSQRNAAADLAALEKEVVALKLDQPLAAPSGGDFRLPAEAGEAWYSSNEAKQLADVVLSYQTATGGWSKHNGYARGSRQPGMQFTSQSEPGKKPHYLATFDNRATIEEMRFLAAVWLATKREDCKAGFVKGLDFVFAAQYPNGGWPQVYPLEGDYHDSITFNDDAMTRVLELLQDIKNGEPCFALLDDARRAKARNTLDAGLDCLFKVQFVQAGERTGWCAQYDPLTLKPSAARAMEPTALGGLETSRILKFLMNIPDPTPDMILAIDCGLRWLEKVQVTGIAKAKEDGRTAYVPDPASTEVYWARFYRLNDSKPVFPGRDGILYETFDEMAANNRLGYDFYSTLPGSVVSNGQKKWRKMLESR